MKKRISSHRSNTKPQYLSYVFKLTVLTAIYLVAAQFGLSLGAVSGFATLVWLPSGIAVAALLLFGSRLWPAVTIGAFLANLLNGAPLFVALGIGIGNTLEAIACIYLLKRKNFRNSFNHIRDVYLFIFTGVPLSSGISATIGVTSLLLGSIVSHQSYYITWISWVMGDAISMLVIVPFVMTWKVLPRIKISLRRVIEAVALVTLLFIVGMIVFFPTNVDYPITYLVFIPLIWTSFRFGQHGATVVVVLLSIMAVIGTVLGLTPFSIGRLSDDLLSVQGFMGIITGTSLILAAVVAERRELERRKDDFIAIASHELKTPVTSLKLHMQLLHRKFKMANDHKSADSVAKMDGQLNKLTDLINDLLDVSKIEEGKLRLNLAEFELKNLVEEIIEEMQLTTRQRIVKKIESTGLVYGDRDRIGQVLANFLSNAIKYSPSANKIVVKATKDKKNVTVSVEDFGFGLTPKEQNKVFERFNRAGQEGKGAMPGLGLGLYISKEIINRHKGKVWVESKKGKGSKFYFSLPLKSLTNSSKNNL